MNDTRFSRDQINKILDTLKEVDAIMRTLLARKVYPDEFDIALGHLRRLRKRLEQLTPFLGLDLLIEEDRVASHNPPT